MVQLASRHAQRLRTLEVGCAQANISTLLAERGYVAFALDLRIGFLEYARMKRTCGHVHYMVASGERLPFTEQSCDVVILGELLEHVAWPEQFLIEARRVLVPGGILIVSTPNGQHRWSTLPTFESIQNSRDQFELRQFGPDGDSHLYLYTPSELRLLLERNGFRVAHLEVYDFDLVRRISNRLLSLRSGTNPLMLAATRPLGWLLTHLDRLLQHLPEPQRSRLAQGIIAAGQCVWP